MRTISAASLAKLSQKTGTEPVCLVEVHWSESNVRTYSDLAVDDVPVESRVLSISSFDDILNVSQSGTSQQITVTLDDSDGELKELFNNVDMHRQIVTIYQWFTGIPYSDRFVLFSGLVASPVVWKEGDRTLTFTVTSQTTSQEVGFSPEEGEFPNLPQGLVGQSWPIVFGTVAKLPLQRVDEIPYKDGTGDLANSTTLEDHGIEDPALAPHTSDQDAQANYGFFLASVYFIGYLQASHTARKRGELGDFDDIEVGTGTFSSLAKQYLAQGNKYLLQAQQVRNKNDITKGALQKQQSYNKKHIKVTNGSMFRQGVTQSVNIGGATYTGIFVGDTLQIHSAIHPSFERYDGMPVVTPGTEDPPIYPARDNFFWNPAGQQLTLGVVGGAESDDPNDIRYIVASTIPVTVNVVYGWQTVNGVKYLNVVPTNYYEVFQTNFGTLPVTLILVPDALSSLTDANGKSLGWDDDLFATCTSTVGPNVVDIIHWLIETYTDHAIDEASFTLVRSLVDAYPAHFALKDRQNVISLVQRIAYESRCIVWMKNNIFHIKYLSRKYSSTATITEADVIEQSLEVSYTETEDLVTKWKVSWSADYQQPKQNYIVLRYNINRYGMQEKSQSYMIYNMQQLVEKSAVFWLIRDSNTFKLVTLKVPIKFLNIETLDTVTLDFDHNFIADGPIDCEVQSAELDTADYTITLKLWVPVRAGEMSEYNFAYPASLEIQYYWPTQDDIKEGRAAGGPDAPVAELPVTGNTKIDKPMTGDTGNGGQIATTRRPKTWGTDPQYFPDAQNTAPTITQRIDSTANRPSTSEKPEGTTQYQLTKAVIKDTGLTNTGTTDTSGNAVFPAVVLSGGPGEGPYLLNVFMAGLDNPATQIENVFQLQIDDDEEIEAGTWVFACRNEFKDTTTSEIVTEWSMQVPVWQ